MSILTPGSREICHKQSLNGYDKFKIETHEKVYREPLIMQKDNKLWSIADRGIGVVQISTHLKGSAPPPPSPPRETLRQQVLSTKIEAKLVRKKFNDLEDLGHSVHKTGKTINRLGDEQSQLQDEIRSLKS